MPPRPPIRRRLVRSVGEFPKPAGL